MSCTLARQSPSVRDHTTKLIGEAMRRQARTVLLCVMVVTAGSLAIRPASAEHELVQPNVTPVGTQVPAAASHIVSTTDAEDASGTSAADRLSIVADTVHALGRDDGFAGQEIDIEDRSITVYWKGGLPPAVEEYGEYAGSLGITVTIESGAVLTREEALAAAEKITRNAELVARAGVTSVSYRANGGGRLIVGLSGEEPSQAIREEIEEATGLNSSRLRYQTSQGSLVNLATRANDSSPWKGGIRTLHGGSACSTAFAALSGSSGRLLSANHCGADKAASDGNGTRIATASAIAGKASIDSMSIDPSASPATTPRVYVGAWNSSTTKTVKNWGSNWVGNTVCAGGATTGSRCGKVIDDAIKYPGLSGDWYVRARATSGAMAGGGDSGGPVYANVSGGVQARGVILGGFNATATSCGSKNPDVTTTCFRDIAYAPISVVLNSWGYSLEVG